MPDVRTFERLRWAGRLETHATARHSLNFYNNIGSSATYSFPGWSGPLEPLIYRALEQVIARHPSLSSIILDESKRCPYFVRLPQFDLKEVVRFTKRKHSPPGEDDTFDIELDQLLAKEHNINFDQNFGEVPFWRLVILQEEGTNSRFTAAFIHHHAIADGTSGMVFHRSFQTALCEATEDFKVTEKVDSIIRPLKQSLLPSLEELHPLPLSWMFVIKEFIKDQFTAIPRNLWVAAPVTPAMPRSHFRSFTLPKDTSAGLLAASRANGTTLTCTVQCALAACLFANLPPHWTLLRCDGAVSMRRWLSQSIVNSDSMGMWTSRYLEEHHRPTEPGPSKIASGLFSWEEARRARKTIEDDLSQEGKNNCVALLRYIWDTHYIFTRKIGKPREQSFEVSNIGVFRSAQAKNESGWKIGRMVFSQSGDVEGAAVQSSVMTGADGRLTIGFAWLEGIVDEGFVDRVMRDFKESLEEISQ